MSPTISQAVASQHSTMTSLHMLSASTFPFLFKCSETHCNYTDCRPHYLVSDKLNWEQKETTKFFQLAKECNLRILCYNSFPCSFKKDTSSQVSSHIYWTIHTSFTGQCTCPPVDNTVYPPLNNSIKHTNGTQALAHGQLSHQSYQPVVHPGGVQGVQTPLFWPDKKKTTYAPFLQKMRIKSSIRCLLYIIIIRSISNRIHDICLTYDS